MYICSIVSITEHIASAGDLIKNEIIDDNLVRNHAVLIKSFELGQSIDQGLKVLTLYQKEFCHDTEVAALQYQEEQLLFMAQKTYKSSL